MRPALILGCAAIVAAFIGDSFAQTVQPGTQQPPVTAPQQPPLVRLPATSPRTTLPGVIIQPTIRTSALTMVGGALATTSAMPRNIRTTNLTMLGGAVSTASSTPRNIRTSALTMRGAP